MEQLARRRWALFIALAAAVVISDQASKLWIDANFAAASIQPLPGGVQPTDVIDSLVRIAKTYNTGGIFGLFGNSAPILAISSTLVIAGIVFYEAREGARGPWLLTVALGLLLGGAIGNFIDRVRLGAVVDFVDMGIGGWRWYTFNVADAAISTSLLLLILFALFGERLTRRLEARAG
jgi:signal peptidase II